ncbi:uncharacterized protein A4U43_C10F19180 [Asparagus officinalis]|uniref:Uncharacterized protein n=1 Tax=Asparagus officinalis TaxID=4686 RepID=A0A5P1E4F3_ASPOF|nr:uncharacterized protein At4g13200, chloroplastic-like isoform X2 [Asparagus officinalis]ONK57349.1 uncharacterized protein A4U43_C10F19180 [Asparagus officinalis]
MMWASSSPFSLAPALKPTLRFSPNRRPFSDSNLRPSARFNFRSSVQCVSSRTPGPDSGENENKVVLDAFFLGKAFAEAVNERIGSAVGEILSVVGQYQAEQQKQVRDFQEEVVERAERAKKKAALEVAEDQGLTSIPLAMPPGSITPIAPSTSGATTEDPFQEMLKD